MNFEIAIMLKSLKKKGVQKSARTVEISKPTSIDINVCIYVS